MGEALRPRADFEDGDQDRAGRRKDPPARYLNHQDLPGVTATLNYIL